LLLNIDPSHFALDEGYPIAVKNFDDGHVKRLSRIVIGKNFYRDIRDKEEVRFAVYQGNLRSVFAIFSDESSSCQSGEITTKDKNTGL
jgi:hypothetical protein